LRQSASCSVPASAYRFADYKVKVIDLLERVTTVSVETQGIISAIRKAER